MVGHTSRSPSVTRVGGGGGGGGVVTLTTTPLLFKARGVVLAFVVVRNERRADDESHDPHTDRHRAQKLPPPRRVWTCCSDL